ncbi:tRNA1(Val) (adenine(37)-N6)-methyltransferase [Pararhodobacter sp. CCB-MM2]|uniref:tRNA1(Val) (adenine(37)-N6)-methyltransferase n=1 Tax=Pararhodobacter sp. CCB-MM2 TaxID=1786003 RepID=UPI000834DF08|nr:methyltransferase domain-containing protein [Pararhodobacter sp. CCB-MM2]
MGDEALTRDIFLGGKLAIWQPREGYRAATDPVLLAAAVPALSGQSVLELGCGAGVALLALGRRVPGLALHGVERQESYAALARRNAGENSLRAEVAVADLTGLPAPLRIGFDHVMANPPYYRPGSPAARDAGRAQALREETPLSDWIAAGLKRVKPDGYLTMIHLADRLPDILCALWGKAGLVVRPIAARQGREAGRVLVQARKGRKSPFRLLAPLVMHEGESHLGDRDDFSLSARAVLRDGAALDWS